MFSCVKSMNKLRIVKVKFIFYAILVVREIFIFKQYSGHSITEDIISISKSSLATILWCLFPNLLITSSKVINYFNIFLNFSWILKISVVAGTELNFWLTIWNILILFSRLIISGIFTDIISKYILDTVALKFIVSVSVSASQTEWN